MLVLCFAAACLPTAVRPQVVSKAANNFTSASSNSTAATVDYEYDDYEDVDGRAREEGGVDGSVEQPYPPIPLQLWSPLRFGPVADEDADIPAGRSDIAGPLEASQLPLRPWGYTTVDRSMTPAQLPSSPLRGSASQRNNEAVTGSQFPALRPLRPQLPAQAPSTVQVAAGRQAPPSDVPMIPLLPEASASPSGEVLLPAVEDVDALMTSQASQEAAASIGRTIRLLVSSRIRDLTSLGVDSLPGARFLTTSRLSPRLAVLEIPEDGRRTLTERFSTQTVGDLIIEEDFEVQAMQQGAWISHVTLSAMPI